jgi:hypothetical protein
LGCGIGSSPKRIAGATLGGLGVGGVNSRPECGWLDFGQGFS